MTIKTKQAGALSLVEQQAAEKLLKYDILEGKQDCPACGDLGIRPRNTDTFCCRACKTAWSLRRGSLLEGTAVPYRTFVRAIRFFATDAPPEKAALSLHQDHKTVLEIYARIRQALNGTGIDHGAAMDHDIRARTQSGECKKGTVMFGIRSENGEVRIERLPVPDPDRFIRIPIPEMLKGNILFINAPGMQYQGFFLYDQDRNGQELIKVPARDEHAWSPLTELWGFVRPLWMRHRKIERNAIPDFLQDLPFRYNNRHHDLETVILQRLAAQNDNDRYSSITGT